MNSDGFLKVYALVSLVMGFLLVCGVLFGPWEIDPQAVNLILIVVQPGSVALGYLLKNRGEPNS